MNINRLIAHNFKGQNIDRTLGPVTLILGDNFTGKTSVADAIRLALAGYLPGVGKTGPLLWGALAGNPDAEGTMEVQVTFDTGRSSKLSFARSKKGSVSQEGAVPADLALDPMLLDVRQFFRLTAQERVKAIFSAAGDVGIDKDQIAEKLWAIEASPVSERDRILRELTEESSKALTENPVQRALEIIAGSWQARLKDARALSKVAAGAFAGMKLPTTMPVNPTGIEAAQIERDALVQKRGELAALLRDSQRVAQLEVAVKNKTAELEAAKAALAAMPELPDPPSQPSILIEHEAAKEEAEKHLERMRTANGELERLRGELESLRGVDLCPHCGMAGGMEKARQNLETRIGELTASVREAWEAHDAIMEPFADVRSVAAQFSNAQEEHERMAEELQKAADKIEELNAAVNSAAAELERLRGDRDELVKTLTEQVAKLPMLETKLSELNAQKAAFESYQKLLADREKRERECLAFACEVEVVDQAIKKLSALVGQESERVFAKVLGLSAAFTAGLINSPLEFRDGELGRRLSPADRAQGRVVPEGAWIPSTSFSGTEDLLAMAGFSVALARLAPFKLVILDELGRLTPDRRQAVAKRVTELVADGVIDQAILIDAGADRKAYKAKGVTVIE